MMADTPTRLLVAYTLIAVMALAVAALVWWRARNTQNRQNARAASRLAERYRQRKEASSVEPKPEIHQH